MKSKTYHAYITEKLNVLISLPHGVFQLEYTAKQSLTSKNYCFQSGDERYQQSCNSAFSLLLLNLKVTLSLFLMTHVMDEKLRKWWIC